jgi:hypothetical protein
MERKQQAIIEAALAGRCAEVAEGLKEFGFDQHSTLHNNVARIAVATRNEVLFQPTEHYPRMLMEEYAPDAAAFGFLLQCYRASGFWKRCDVPDYVWEAASLPSARLLHDRVPSAYALHRARPEVQAHFGFIGLCETCREPLAAESDRRICRASGCTSQFCTRCVHSQASPVLCATHCRQQDNKSLLAINEVMRTGDVEPLHAIHGDAIAYCLLWIFYVRVEPDATQAQQYAALTHEWWRLSKSSEPDTLAACEHWLHLSRPRFRSRAPAAFHETLFECFLRLRLDARIWSLLEPYIVSRALFTAWAEKHGVVLTGSTLLALVLGASWPGTDIDLHVAHAPDDLELVFKHPARRSISVRSCSALQIGQCLEISWNHAWRTSTSWEVLDNTWNPERGLDMSCEAQVFAREGQCDVFEELLLRVQYGQSVPWALDRIVARLLKYTERGFLISF